MVLRFALNRVLGPEDVPFLLAFPAVVSAAWIGGLGPALLCSIVSAVLADYWFFPPAHAFTSLTRPQVVSTFVFLTASCLIGMLGERTRRAISRLSAELVSSLQKESALRSTGEKLRAAEEAQSRLAAIVTSCDDAIISMDLEGTITSWNAAATRMFHFAPDEVVGKSIYLLVPPELHEEERQILETIARGERVDHLETVRLRKGSEPLQVSLSVSAILDRQGRVIGVSKISRDITEDKRTERALRKTELEAAKGRLAATIAHEINNPLEAITNIGYLISRAPELNPDSRELVATLNREVYRVSDITRQALAFYRESAVPSAVSVREVVESVMELFRRRIAQKSVQIQVLHGEDVPRVMVKTGELRQVIANLLANALDAVSQDGRITIRTSATRARVKITVSDNGEGVPRDRRDLMFRPFETTKGDQGTGLGLWVSKGLMEKYGGTILYRSSQDSAYRGTSFMVLLPKPGDASGSGVTHRAVG